MTITLNHTIVPSRDKAAAARNFAQLFGLASAGLRWCSAMVRRDHERN